MTLGAILFVFVGLPIIFIVGYLGIGFGSDAIGTTAREKFVKRAEKNEFESEWGKLRRELRAIGFDIYQEQHSFDWFGDVGASFDWSGIDGGSEFDYDTVFSVDGRQGFWPYGPQQRLIVFVEEDKVIDIWSMNLYR